MQCHGKDFLPTPAVDRLSYTLRPPLTLLALSPTRSSSSTTPAAVPLRLLAVVLWLSLRSRGPATPPTPPSLAAHAATPALVEGGGLVTELSRVGRVLLISGR